MSAMRSSSLRGQKTLGFQEQEVGPNNRRASLFKFPLPLPSVPSRPVTNATGSSQFQVPSANYPWCIGSKVPRRKNTMFQSQHLARVLDAPCAHQLSERHRLPCGVPHQSSPNPKSPHQSEVPQVPLVGNDTMTCSTSWAGRRSQS